MYDPGSVILDTLQPGSKILGQGPGSIGCMILDLGARTHWICDPRSRILDPRSWIKDPLDP